MKRIEFLSPTISAQQLLQYAIMAILIFSQSSCFKQYYQTNTMHKVDSMTLEQLRAEKKNFIIHTASRPFALNNVKLSVDTLSGDIGSLNPTNDRLLNPQAEYKNVISLAEKKIVTTEVHLYTESIINGNDHVSIALNQINRMDVYGLDKKAIRGSRITGIIVITVGVAAAIGIAAIVMSGLSTMVFAGFFW